MPASDIGCQDFFDEVARVLKPEGLVTVVTDNLW